MELTLAIHIASPRQIRTTPIVISACQKCCFPGYWSTWSVTSSTVSTTVSTTVSATEAPSETTTSTPTSCCCHLQSWRVEMGHVIIVGYIHVRTCLLTLYKHILNINFLPPIPPISCTYMVLHTAIKSPRSILFTDACTDLFHWSFTQYSRIFP